MPRYLALTGYGGGIERKQALLRLEGAYEDRFFAPKPRAGR